ncbi:MAG: M20 family metallopeptidase [Candidatus Bathyarchaeota archaeon]|nr:M20 family metallopeptidase [Candidatus Bathyarchaeota archaeon]
MYEDLLSKLDDTYTLRKLEEMIKIPSVVKEEKELAHYLQGELESLGMETELHMVEPGRPNIYGKLKGKGEGKRINFGGHMDTVPVVPYWDTDPFKPVVKDGKIYGLGSNDMKGGLACVLNMIRAVAESGYEFNGELSFSGVIDEEAFGEGAKAMLKTEYGKVDAVVLAEPHLANEQEPTALGITGKVLYDIYVKGKAAHGFSPEKGINAVEQAGIILANLHKLRIPEHPLFKGNYSTLKIEGGYKVYSVVVPAECRFEVNRLTVPGETMDSVIKDMEDLVKTLNLDAEVEVKTKPPYYSSYVLDKNEPLIQVFDWAYRETTGKKPHYGYNSSITDANTLTGEGGIPCVHFGPYPGGSHQKNEYTTLDSLPPASKVYALMAAKFLS